MNIPKEHITGIILAGGKSTRIGRDKSLLHYQNKTLIQHSIDALQPLVSTIIIVSDNPNHDYKNTKRVSDLIPNSGPVAGIYTGLHHSKTENNIVLSCDIPKINSIILKKLISNSFLSFDVVQLESNGQQMPLIASYKKHCSEACLSAIKNGERRLQKVVKTLNTHTILLQKEERNSTININTPKQLKTLHMQTTKDIQLPIKYFGMLTEITNCTEEIINISKPLVSDLLALLYLKYPLLEEKEFQIAQNQILITESTELTTHEVALLPPFSGG